MRRFFSFQNVLGTRLRVVLLYLFFEALCLYLWWLSHEQGLIENVLGDPVGVWLLWFAVLCFSPLLGSLPSSGYWAFFLVPPLVFVVCGSILTVRPSLIGARESSGRCFLPACFNRLPSRSFPLLSLSLEHLIFLYTESAVPVASEIPPLRKSAFWRCSGEYCQCLCSPQLYARTSPHTS